MLQTGNKNVFRTLLAVRGQGGAARTGHHQERVPAAPLLSLLHRRRCLSSFEGRRSPSRAGGRRSADATPRRSADTSPRRHPRNQRSGTADRRKDHRRGSSRPDYRSDSQYQTSNPRRQAHGYHYRFQKRADGKATIPPVSLESMDQADTMTMTTTTAMTNENATGAKLQSLCKDLDSLLTSYESILFPLSKGDDGDGKEEKEEKASVPQASKNHENGIELLALEGIAKGLHRRSSETDAAVSWQQLEDSERVFRELCRILLKLMGGPYGESSSEICLRILLELRFDRQHLVNQLMKKQEGKSATPESTILTSLTSWMTSVFVRSDSPDNDDPLNERKVTAHEDHSLLPRTRHFKALASDIYYCTASPVNRAERLTKVYNLMNQLNNHVLDTPNSSISGSGNDFSSPIVVDQVLMLVLKAHGAVGSMEFAQRAEQLWREHCQKNEDARLQDGSGTGDSTGQLFHSVLRAYRDVKADDGRSRSKTAQHVEQLVLEALKVRDTRASPWTTDEQDTITSIVIALQAMVNAGNSIPDRCKRAEKLLLKQLEQQEFDAIFDASVSNEKKLMTESKLQLLTPLIAVYSTQRDGTYMKKALEVLQFMEEQQDLRRQMLGSAHDKQQGGAALPSLETYRYILKAIRHYSFLPSNPHATGNAGDHAKQLFELAKLATSFLSKMAVQNPRQLPDAQFYDLLLKVWVRIMHKDCGEYAQEILHEMQLRDVLSETPGAAKLVTMNTYVLVLKCWKLSASKAHAHAAERAHRLLRFMEVIAASEGEQADGVGGRDSGTEACNLLLRTCAYWPTRDTFQIALDVFSRIQSPGKQSLQNLQQCVKFMDSESHRQDAIAQIVQHLESRGSNLNEFGKDALQAMKDLSVHNDMTVLCPEGEKKEEEKTE